MSRSNPSILGLETQGHQAIFIFSHTLVGSSSDSVVEDQISLDLREGFTVSTWAQFTPKKGRESIGDILSIESPSLSSPIFSIWVELPEYTIHFSCMEEEDDIIKVIKTGVKVPTVAFHLAVEYDSSVFTLYLNGEWCKSIRETSALPNPERKLVAIGRSEGKGHKNSRCIRRIFDVTIYPGTLGEGHIKYIFADATRQKPPVSAFRHMPSKEKTKEKEAVLNYGENSNIRSEPIIVFSAPKLVTRDFASNNSLWKTRDDLRLVADIRNHGKVDLVGFGYSGVYVSKNEAKGFTHANKVISGFSRSLGWQTGKHLRVLADTTGDGYPDIIGFGQREISISFNNHDGTFQASKTVIKELFCNVKGWSEDKNPRFVADLTGNGAVDIIGFTGPGVFVAFNKGDGAFHTPQKVLDSFGYNDSAGNWRVEKHPRFLTDLTGDGRPDIVGFGDFGVAISLNNGDGTFQPTRIAVHSFGYTTGDWRVDRHPRFLADLTGDGRADVIGFGEDGVYVALNDGDGMFQPVQKVLDWFGSSDIAGAWTVDKHPRFMADLTGDKCADIVGFYGDSVWVACNKGNGTFYAPRRVISDFGYNAGEWQVDKNPRFLADLTGDGRADIIGFGDDGVYVSFNGGDGAFDRSKKPAVDDL